MPRSQACGCIKCHREVRARRYVPWTKTTPPYNRRPRRTARQDNAEGGPVRQQEQRQLRNLIRGTQTAQRVPRNQAGTPFLRDILQQSGPDVPGVDRVNSNSLVRAAQGSPVQRPWPFRLHRVCRDIRDALAIADKAENRGRIDDGTPPAASIEGIL
jgi:hypothetical protein